jgi:hypothetical protein
MNIFVFDLDKVQKPITEIKPKPDNEKIYLNSIFHIYMPPMLLSSR